MRLELTLPSKCTRSIVIIISRLMGIPPISKFGSWSDQLTNRVLQSLLSYSATLVAFAVQKPHNQPYGFFPLTIDMQSWPHGNFRTATQWCWFLRTYVKFDSLVSTPSLSIEYVFSGYISQYLPTQMVWVVRLELTTPASQMRCSTNWATPR